MKTYSAVRRLGGGERLVCEVGNGAKPRTLFWSEARSWAADQGAVAMGTKFLGTRRGFPLTSSADKARRSSLGAVRRPNISTQPSSIRLAQSAAFKEQ